MDDEPVVTIINCGHFWMPIAQLDDPESVRATFQALTSPQGIKHPESTSRLDFENFGGEIELLKDGEMIRSVKTFSADELFFREHFKRMPVVPLTLVNEFLGRETSKIFGERIPMACVRTSNLRMKDFIRPGDTINATIEVKSHENSLIKTVGKIFKNGTCIMRGDYEYQYLNG